MIASMAPKPAATPASLGCTCERLRRLTRRVTAMYDRELAPTGLRVTQFSLLATLRRSGAAGIAITELAARMEMDRTTLTRNLRPLLDQDLAALVADPADARVRRAALSANGAAAFDAARPHWRKAQEFVNRTLGEADVAALHDWLDRVTPVFHAPTAEE
jgi:DNA-binding MarR family transcriptional regulator